MNELTKEREGAINFFKEMICGGSGKGLKAKEGLRLWKQTF